MKIFFYKVLNKISYILFNIARAIKILAFRLKWQVSFRKNTTDNAVFNQVISDFHGSFNRVKTPKVIIDAGANVGFTSIYLADKFKDAIIYSIEPEKSNFLQLTNNCKNYKNIIPLNCALSGKTGKLKLYDVEEGEWAFSSVNVNMNKKSIGTFDSISIPELMSKYHIDKIDVLKIDIEGSEIELFETSPEEWLENVNVIIVEPHDWLDKRCSTTIFNALFKMNFCCETNSEHLIFYDIYKK